MCHQQSATYGRRRIRYLARVGNCIEDRHAGVGADVVNRDEIDFYAEVESGRRPMRSLRDHACLVGGNRWSLTCPSAQVNSAVARARFADRRSVVSRVAKGSHNIRGNCRINAEEQPS